MSYAIMRFQKCAAGGVPARNRHNERLKSEYKSNPKIDPNRSRLNYHLVEPNGKYKQRYTEMIEQAGCRTRANSVVMVETMLTASPEFISKLNPEEQRQYFERAAAFLYNRIGKEHVISAIVHMDETSPHMHLCFCPITKDGRLSAKDILGNRARMSEWQDDFYEYMHGFYPELERGLPSAITHRKHIPPYLFRAMDNASKSYDAIMKALSDVNVFNAGKKRDEAVRVLGQLMPDLYKLQAQSRLIDKQAKAMKAAIEQKDRQIAEQGAQLEDQDADLFALQCRIDLLQAEKDKAVAVIDMLPPDVRTELEKRTNQYSKER